MSRQTALKLDKTITIEIPVDLVENLCLHIQVAQDQFKASPTLRKTAISLKQVQEVEKIRKRLMSAINPKPAKK